MKTKKQLNTQSGRLNNKRTTANTKPPQQSKYSFRERAIVIESSTENESSDGETVDSEIESNKKHSGENEKNPQISGDETESLSESDVESLPHKSTKTRQSPRKSPRKQPPVIDDDNPQTSGDETESPSESEVDSPPQKNTKKRQSLRKSPRKQPPVIDDEDSDIISSKSRRSTNRTLRSGMECIEDSPQSSPNSAADSASPKLFSPADPESPGSQNSSVSSFDESRLRNETSNHAESIHFDFTPIMNVDKLPTTNVEKQPPNTVPYGHGAPIEACKIKDHLSIYYNERGICDEFAKRENLQIPQMKILWNSYLEFMTIKIIGCDTGLDGLIRYSTCTEMHKLWHAHVLNTHNYRTFMALINNINPLIEYLDPSIEHANSTEETKKRQIQNTKEAYRKLFKKECPWLSSTQEDDEIPTIEVSVPNTPNTTNDRPSTIDKNSNKMSISSETSKKKRRYNTAIAYRKLFNKECKWIYDETEPNPPIPIKESRKRKQKSVADEYSKIYVKSLNGNKTHTIRIVSCMTVKQLKQLIKTLDGTSVERQHLILAGKELQDQCLLGHYCVRSGCTMHLVCSKTSRMLQKVNFRRSP
uniref:Ubiquitin-like domain-containing protein n=1 Tax=Clytia hemisphaerica TaxID=252671 RepID=A0A7M5WW72_9CNID